MDNAICCIEEPEIHFHPILQKEFLRFLVDNTENTFFISTHSPAFINAIKDSTKVQLIHLKKVGQITEQSSIFKKGETWDLLKDIGVNPSDLLQSNCIIWVEGPSDIYYLKKWISLLDSNLVDNRDYSFFCYSIHRTLFIDNEEIDNTRTNVLSINRNSIVVVDSDKKNTEDKIKTEKSHIIESCKKNNIHCWLTDRREIENYLSKSTVKRALKSLRDVEVEIEIGMFDDIGERMDQELKSKKLLPLNYCNNKTSLANKFSSFIELEDIDKELMENISALIQKIKSFN